MMTRFALASLLALLLASAAHATDADTMMLADPNGALNLLLHKRYEKALNAQSKPKDKPVSTPDDADAGDTKPADGKPATTRATNATGVDPRAIDPKTVLVKPKIAKPSEATAQKIDLKHGKASPELNRPEHRRLDPPPAFQRITPQLSIRPSISNGPFTIPQPAEPAQ
jgi:hypothetical protein